MSRICSAAIRYQTILAALAIALQRLPLVRLMAGLERAAGGAAARIARAATATVLGGIHARSGATTFTVQPASPISARVSDPTQIAFSISGTPEPAQSWRVTGSIPPGLSVPGLSGQTLNQGFGTIVGVPTMAGAFEVRVQPFDLPNLEGDTNGAPFSIVINVAASEPPIALVPPERIEIALTAGGRLTLTFDAIDGLRYQLERNADLSPDGWEAVGASADGAGGALTFTVDEGPPEAGHFFRVVVSAAE